MNNIQNLLRDTEGQLGKVTPIKIYTDIQRNKEIYSQVENVHQW